MRAEQWDVVIVGAGAAGLSAALVLGRACRKVLVCDKGTPRNWASKEMHSFVTRDGIDPSDFRAIARKELARYKQVTFRAARVTGASAVGEQGFRITLEGTAPVRSRKLLLATGVVDQLPSIEGIEDFFGVSAFQCPYCHGWENRGAPIAVYGRRQRGFEMARAMTAWTDDIVLCTDGPSSLSADAKNQLHRNGVQIHTGRIARLQGEDGQLKSIVFQDGSTLERAALFFDTPSTEQSNLARSLGCEFSAKGGVKCGEHEASSVPGVFVAGNIIRDVQLAIVAASEGAKAAFGINRALTREDFERHATGKKRIEHPLPADVSPARRPKRAKSR
jgi:thioredoxin reductase